MHAVGRRLAPTLRSQLGLITRRQVLAAGASPNAIRRRIRSGRWEAVDIGNVITFDRYRTVVGDLREYHGLDWVDLDRCWRMHSRRGRNGCGALHRLLDLHFGAVGAPREVVEARCAAIIANAGLEEPEHQYRVRRPDGRLAILDLAYPLLRIGIETEGKIHNRDEVRQADHTRRNNLQLNGWILFHFTWEDVVYRPDMVARVVREAIELRRRERSA